MTTHERQYQQGRLQGLREARELLFKVDGGYSKNGFSSLECDLLSQGFTDAQLLISKKIDDAMQLKCTSCGDAITKTVNECLDHDGTFCDACLDCSCHE